MLYAERLTSLMRSRSGGLFWYLIQLKTQTTPWQVTLKAHHPHPRHHHFRRVSITLHARNKVDGAGKSNNNNSLSAAELDNFRKILDVSDSVLLYRSLNFQLQ